MVITASEEVTPPETPIISPNSDIAGDKLQSNTIIVDQSTSIARQIVKTNTLMPTIIEHPGNKGSKSDGSTKLLTAVIGICVLVIIVSITTLHFYYKHPKELDQTSLGVSNDSGLNPNSPFKYTSQSIRFISFDSEQRNRIPKGLKELEPVKHAYDNGNVHISKYQEVSIVKHLYNGFFLTTDNLALPISLIPVDEIPSFILVLSTEDEQANLDHQVINYAIENYPEKILINILPRFEILSPASYMQDGIFKSLSDSKIILIKGDDRMIKQVSHYLDGITDKIWSYFDKTIVDDNFRIEECLQSYDPFE
ncbi:hypothetical protein HDV04_001172 [Boothiomyces sp. JEL0838]|nr:hypothetical protein HDV04_001172 [Boothiomyces sp. JEL0838]